MSNPHSNTFNAYLEKILLVVEGIALTKYADNTSISSRLRQEGFVSRKFYCEELSKLANQVKNEIKGRNIR